MILASLLWAAASLAGAGTIVGTPPPATVASSSPTVVASLGNMVGKTNVLKTGTLTTTTKAAAQVVLTYTVTGGKFLYLQAGNIIVTSTVPASKFTDGVNPGGSIWWESPSGTAISSFTWIQQSSAALAGVFYLPDAGEPVPLPGGTILRVVVTPDTTQTIRWVANFFGYEK